MFFFFVFIFGGFPVRFIFFILLYFEGLEPVLGFLFS